MCVINYLLTYLLTYLVLQQSFNCFPAILVIKKHTLQKQGLAGYGRER